MEVTLRAALPESFLVKPTGWNQALDLTDLVEEWTLALLDPVDALRCSAKRMLKAPKWELCAKATVSVPTMRLIREAADDPDVVAAVKGSAYKSFVKEEALTPQGVCLLLGLAAAVAIEANVGWAAALFLRDFDKRAVEDARVERAKAEQASAATSDAKKES
jgi:hypothetical protein